jgi:hypothetical protein
MDGRLQIGHPFMVPERVRLVKMPAIAAAVTASACSREVADRPSKPSATSSDNILVSGLAPSTSSSESKTASLNIQSVEDFKKYGAQIRLTEDLPGKPLTFFQVSRSNSETPLTRVFDDHHLALLKGETALRELGLNRTGVTDQGLACLGDLKNLEVLDLTGLRGKGITDAGLNSLMPLKKLRMLGLGGNSEITDAGLYHLQNLTNLELLAIQETRVSGVGLKHLKGLTRLSNLNLDSTRVTDKDLESIKAFVGLKMLVVRNTAVTDDGVAELKKSLPDLEVVTGRPPK